MPDSPGCPAFFFIKNRVTMLNRLYPEIKALVLDMDGVLWRGPKPIGDLKALFDRMNSLGLKVICATNNATSTPDQFAAKLAEHRVIVSPEIILNSAVAAACYLKNQHPSGGPVHLVGEIGLQQAMQDQGFWHAEEEVLAVVVGMDRSFTYQKMAKASRLIRGGAAFIGTNADKTFPTPDGLTPGAGSILAGIQTASGVEPIILGKPSPYLYQLALERLGTRPQETLAVGDRLETDILGGQRAGMPTALVLSGVTTQEELSAWPTPPDLVADNLSALLGLHAVDE
jgi:4-nitrophenyl phosphatase